MEFLQLPGICNKRVFAIGSVAFLLLITFSSQSDAQLFRRHRAKQFNSNHRFVEAAANDWAANGAVDNWQGSGISNQATVSRLPKWPFRTGYDPRIHRDADGWAQYPKYIGGFHSSHFTNVGLPSGDIGFRGNGLYWTPW